MRPHPRRIELHDEIHTRPRTPVTSPNLVSHISLTRQPGDPSLPAGLAAWCVAHDIAPPADGARHFGATVGAHRLKWERHGEFDDYTLYLEAPSAVQPFADAVGDRMLATLGEDPRASLIAALRIAILGAQALPVTPDIDAARINALLGSTDFVGSRISDSEAALFTSFRLDADGFGRFLIVDVGTTQTQLGRAVQRVIEIEVYRMMAMLAFPEARRIAAELDSVDSSLSRLVARLDVAPATEEPEMLREVTRLSAIIERLSSESAFRFGAARAYRTLVKQRGGELREQRLPRLQHLGGFLERRFEPAMAFCDSVASRLETSASRIARASSLLRTRVETEREQQNQALLGALNRRARLQLHLQQTVEGLSVAAITYYGVGLAAYLFKGAARAGLAIDADLATGLSVIPIALMVALGVRAVRRALMRNDDPA
jgi:uncharacterized membrane-anchored protein